jgi:hypothetical protein
MALIKQIKNKSRSYKKLKIHQLDIRLTLDFLFAIPLNVIQPEGEGVVKRGNNLDPNP